MITLCITIQGREDNSVRRQLHITKHAGFVMSTSSPLQHEYENLKKYSRNSFTLHGTKESRVGPIVPTIT